MRAAVATAYFLFVVALFLAMFYVSAPAQEADRRSLYTCEQVRAALRQYGLGWLWQQARAHRATMAELKAVRRCLLEKRNGDHR